MEKQSGGDFIPPDSGQWLLETSLMKLPFVDSWREIISSRNFQRRLFALAVFGRNYVSSKDYLHWAKTWRTQLDVNKFYFCLPWQQHFSPCLSVPSPPGSSCSFIRCSCLSSRSFLFFCFWWFIKRGRINPSLHLFDMKHPAGSQMDLCFSSPCMAYNIVPMTVFALPWLYLRTMNWCSGLEDLHDLPFCLRSFPPKLCVEHIATNFTLLFSAFLTAFWQRKKCISLKINDIFITQ